MVSHRTLFWVLQAFMALLLIAAVPASLDARPKAEVLLEVIQGSARPLGLRNSAKDYDRALTASAFLEVDDDDPHAGPASRAGAAETYPPDLSLVEDYSSAALSHPACAAPPTGPPHA